MSAADYDDPVTWVLETIVAEWPAGEFPDSVERINRDDSANIDQDQRTRTTDLQDATYIGASFADETTEPMGVDYHEDVEAIVSVRIEGLHEDEYGHVESSTAFNHLVRQTKQALKTQRVNPTIDPPADRTFYLLEVQNDDPNSDSNRDYFRHDYEVLFRGYEYFDT